MAAFCLYRQVDSEIRRHFEARLSQHYKGLNVKVGATRLVEGKGIQSRDISICDPKADGSHAELLRVEEAFFECPTDWQELIKGNPPIRRITLRRATLRAVRMPDGSWSSCKLLPPPQTGNRPPQVTIENAVVEIVDPLKMPASTLALRDVNMTIEPTSNDTVGANAGIRSFRGTMAGNGFRRVEFEGRLDMRTSSCSVRGKAEGVAISPELRDNLPEAPAAKLAACGDLRGLINMAFQIDYDPAASVPLRFNVSGQLTHGRIDDPRLPQPFTDIEATAQLTNAGCTIENLTARSGRTTLRLAGRTGGYDATSPMVLRTVINQLDLDPALFRVLPPSLQEAWRHYSPSGQINVDAQLEYDGHTWRPEATVRCFNIGFSSYKFPYRLEHGTGSLELKDDILKIDLTAFSGRQPVIVTAEISGPFHPDPAGRTEINGANIQIDEAMIAAMPEKTAEVVRSLEPRGLMNVYILMWRSRRGEPIHKKIVLDVNNTSVRYEKFPYPLTDISGRLEMFDHDWKFRNLVGRHNGARVTCEGHFRVGERTEPGVEPLVPDFGRPPQGDTPDPVVSPRLTPIFQGNELVLNFTGEEVPLEEELRNALLSSPHIQQVWLHMRPKGIVNLTAQARYMPEKRKFSIAVHVEPQRDTTSVEPTVFPYRIERLQGAIDYSDGHVTFRNCRAEHGPTKAAVKIATDGFCDFQPDGRWTVCFQNLTVDQIRIDRELTEALPERLKKAAVELSPNGAMNLRGSFELGRTGRPEDPLQSRWNIRVGLQQNTLQCGDILLDNICGAASFRGSFDGLHATSRGELDLDSISYKDYQLTRVVGPMSIEDGRVMFGAWVDNPTYGIKVTDATGPLQSPRSLSANLFGGALYGDGWIALGSTPTYTANLTLNDANLGRCSQEVMGGHQKLRGKIRATADIQGAGRTRNLLSCKGKIALSEADVYELPVMLSLLKLLSIRPPDQNAFSDAEIDYRVVGEHVYFDNIVFHGDAVSLRGAGHMGSQSQVDLTFYALVGRSELEIPVIKQVVRAAAQQLMLIRVGGTLQNPEPRQEALPALNQALQQIRAELENRK